MKLPPKNWFSDRWRARGQRPTQPVNPKRCSRCNGPLLITEGGGICPVCG